MAPWRKQEEKQHITAGQIKGSLIISRKTLSPQQEVRLLSAYLKQSLHGAEMMCILQADATVLPVSAL